MRSATFLACCLLAALPESGIAQAPDTSPRRQAAFERLRDSQLVRLSAPSVGIRQGRVLEHDPSQLVLSSDPQPLRVPATTIDTLWTRGGSARTGAIVGGLLGLGLGVLAGTELGEENAGSAKNVIGMGGIGMMGGALLGAAIGAPIRRWHRRYP